jgi:hypothetical protein
MGTPRSHPLYEALDDAAHGRPPSDAVVAKLVADHALDDQRAATVRGALASIAAAREQGYQAGGLHEAVRSTFLALGLEPTPARPGSLDGVTDPDVLANALGRHR